jgi:Holliday junction DNA helicase RuvA
VIVGLEGKVVYKDPSCVHINVHGVVYAASISLQTYSSLGNDVYLHTVHIVREDAHLLVGFSTLSEKAMFEALVKISGIGPKVALAICSTMSSQRFGEVIASNDLGAFKIVPGVGPKMASRILVELAGFVPAVATASALSISEGAMALENLGFKKEEIVKVLSSIDPNLSTTEVVKEALKKFQKGTK